jgi:hypothetical protein
LVASDAEDSDGRDIIDDVKFSLTGRQVRPHIPRPHRQDSTQQLLHAARHRLFDCVRPIKSDVSRLALPGPLSHLQLTTNVDDETVWLQTDPRFLQAFQPPRALTLGSTSSTATSRSPAPSSERNISPLRRSSTSPSPATLLRPSTSRTRRRQTLSRCSQRPEASPTLSFAPSSER